MHLIDTLAYNLHMSKEDPYSSIRMPDGTTTTFEMQGFPHDALPLTESSLPPWIAKVQAILAQQTLSQTDRWSLIKPYYYGGLSLLANIHVAHTIQRIKDWKPGDVLGRFPVSTPETRYLVQLTAYHHACLQQSYEQAMRLYPPHFGARAVDLPPREQRIFAQVSAIHQSLFTPDSKGERESVAHRLQSGMGTALEHMFALLYQAPFHWREHSGTLPTQAQLGQLFETTFSRHLSPLSHTHLVALVAHEIANGISRERPEEALFVLETTRGAAHLAFRHTPARLSEHTLFHLSQDRHAPNTPRLGCPARLTHDKFKPIRELYSVLARQSLELYAATFGGSVDTGPML